MAAMAHLSPLGRGPWALTVDSKFGFTDYLLMRGLKEKAGIRAKTGREDGMMG